MRRRVLVLSALVGACLGGPREEQGVIAEERGPRLTVEVLNGSGARGLARLGTRVLRERGLDVVAFGNAEATAESTLVLVRRGPPEAGERVRRALGAGQVRVAPDTLRRVDVTVVLGRDYAPPADVRP